MTKIWTPHPANIALAGSFRVIQGHFAIFCDFSGSSFKIYFRLLIQIKALTLCFLVKKSEIETHSTTKAENVKKQGKY